MKPMIPKRTRRLRARAATMNTHEEEFEDYGPEPNMKLSHAFMVVLLLHVIAVGGLYAFNSMKAGKQAVSKTAKATLPVEQPPEPSENQNPKPGEPRNQPPSQPKAPLVAKAAEAPKATAKSTANETVKGIKSMKAPEAAPKGILASAKSTIQKAAGISAVTAGMSKASAQEKTNSGAVSSTPSDSTSPVTATTDSQTQSPPSASKTYIVKAGDTITRIASTVGVSIPDLEKANGLVGNAVLQVGQALKVPERAITQAATDASAQVGKIAGGIANAATNLTGVKQPLDPGTNATPPAIDQAGMTEYTVVKGDNPYKMAKRFKITPDELMKANVITDPKKIQIGQKLMIPAPTKKSAK